MNVLCFVFYFAGLITKEEEETSGGPVKEKHMYVFF
jgi:hypothetical protein